MTRGTLKIQWGVMLPVCLVAAGCGMPVVPASPNHVATAPSSTVQPTAARPAVSSGREEVMLLAAASTANAVAEIAQMFEHTQRIKVNISTGSSSGLAQQIIAGAPADVFLSANEQWGAAIVEKGRAEQVRPLLSNRLVLIVPRGNPARVNSLADLPSDRVHRIAMAGESVPAGIYADQALQNVGLHEALWNTGKIVRGHDVRIALGYVEQAEADAGIVYETDAHLTDRVEIVFAFPAETHEPIRYPALLLKRDEPRAAAALFFKFLTSERAGAVFRKYGFVCNSAGTPTINGSR